MLEMFAAFLLMMISLSFSEVVLNCFDIEPEGDVHTPRVSRKSVGSFCCIKVGSVLPDDINCSSSGVSSIESCDSLPSESQPHCTKYQ